MDPILDLLIQSHGDTLGRFICGAYRLAATATGEAKKRETAEAALQQLQQAPEPARGEVSA